MYKKEYQQEIEKQTKKTESLVDNCLKPETVGADTGWDHKITLRR